MFITNAYHQARRERGDTIVEVLISIAVVSLILGGAYVTTNRSLQNTRASEERGNALKLVESQIEQLKGMIAQNSSAVFGGTAPASFCMSGTTVPLPSSATAACMVDSSGSPVGAAVQPQYRLSITRSVNTFTVTNQWTNVGGRGNDQVTMTYRVYQ